MMRHEASAMRPDIVRLGFAKFVQAFGSCVKMSGGDIL